MANLSSIRPDFSGQTALAGLASNTSANPDIGVIGLIFGEMAHLGKLNLRGQNDLAKTVKVITGCTFPPKANRFQSAGDRHVIWLGPDEYLLLCEAGKEQELQDSLNSMIPSPHFAITDVSDSLCALSLRGPAVRAVLAKGCGLDLHPKKFTAGQSAQSLLALSAVTLMALADDAFILICRTSFAPYVQRWLADAALEYGYQYIA
ncbi:sarcosine oxidase subunit gamma [Alphaproteobacteria bacterium]|nr:sarcosine oxidase subunit gamma [Alphaproteobacteria bacterium]